ncbi:unnamed protein product [Caenorhabditis auriculariae]|uniref:Uncharacterized protein n=1 Tax=Caenorhabditis auriculariae TaxID=2777116 RepID=A0A8S1H8F4_9PELO|nr:unnamed protein product [Caenorhabditis auriculariae]
MWPSASNHDPDEIVRTLDGVYGYRSSQATSSTAQSHGRYSLDSGISGFNDSVLSQNESLISASSFDINEESLASFDQSPPSSSTGPRPAPSSEDQEYSPPTKWPRIVTPPTRRAIGKVVPIPPPLEPKNDEENVVLESEEKPDESLDMSFYSPPISNKAILNESSNSRILPLRTPKTTRRSHKMFATPSPFRSLSFSTPTVSTVPLRLSNQANATKFRISGGRISDSIDSTSTNNLLDFRPIRRLSENVNKSSPKKECPQTPSRSILSGDGAFEGFECLPNGSPSKSFEPSVELDAAGFSLEDVKSYENERFRSERETPTLTPSTKRNRRSVGDLMFCGGVRSPEEKSNSPIPSTYDFSLSNQPIEKEPTVKVKKKEEEILRPAKLEGPFRTPRKLPRLYSHRWMQIATGGTTAQQELTAQAYAYLKSRKSLKRKSDETELTSTQL